MERKQYLINVNRAIDRSVVHYWGTAEEEYYPEGIDKFHLRVPIYENYILYFMSYINPNYYLRYTFTDYHLAIERGVGWCDQKTIIFIDIMDSQNIESRMIIMPEHVVATALVDPKTDEWWVFDPDYGVVIKHNIQDIERNPELIRDDYIHRGYSNQTVDNFVEIFGQHDKTIVKYISEQSTIKPSYEKVSYILIWVIPICLVLPLTIGILHKAARKYKRKNQ